ncbi:AAA family ATPase [Microbacterium sp. zg-YB36]|uniref:AAA family ATPase n=1 Tax=Microbacterium sp. zg-YB36 TaxID=2969407 RepID=UPI00214CB055|nr:AAA family ATPase [Microbacterium sp. zg-YB36]MDL5351053.1 AAA family ATPase [Microbacterium sp. zg-YB36]
METNTAIAAPVIAETARDLLIAWANAQDGWVRLAAAKVLESGSELDGSDIDALYAQYLAEKGLSEVDVVKVELLSGAGGAAEDGAALKLVRLESVEGVNALASDQQIEFNPQLTVVFGENGAGKTGYTRVLKRAAKTRSAETVLGNVHSPAGRQPSAQVTWSLDGVEVTHRWENEEGLFPLTRVDVFDAPAVLMHVDTDLTYSYTPADIALFKHVSDAIRAVSERAGAEIDDRAPKSPSFLQRYERGTRVYPLVETLSAATDLAVLQGLADVSESEIASVPEIQQAVTALQSDNIAAQQAVARNRYEANTQLSAAVAAVQQFNADAYNATLENLAEAIAAQDQLTVTTSTTFGIPGAESPQWQTFVRSGDEYRRHLGLVDYPHEGDACLYCRQPLSADQIELLKAYQDLATNAAQAMISHAQNTAGTLIGPLVSIDTERLLAALSADSDGGREDPHTDAALKMIEWLRTAQDNLNVRSPVAWDAPSGLNELSVEAGRRVEASRSLLSELAERSDTRAEKLSEEKSRLAELQSRIRLQADLSDITAYVEDAKWTAKAKQAAGRLSTTSTSLTRVTKEAGELLLNGNFEARFEKERIALRAPEVKLDFPGRQGTTRRLKTVQQHKPSEVLSEGEQKAIALADFLAESGLRSSSAPVVFDDPVNSLDYRRIEEVSARIAVLAEQRQVIVFTHNIWFATELLSRFDKKQASCSYYSIEDDGETKGIVTAGNHPRWDTVKKLTSKVDSMQRAARGAEGETREALVEKCYSLLRSWIEVVVEQEILQQVVQRYQPNIMLTRLPAIDGQRLDKAKQIIYPLYEKACRIMDGHSQPLETLSVRPKLDEFETEWAQIQQARKDYIS